MPPGKRIWNATPGAAFLLMNRRRSMADSEDSVASVFSLVVCVILLLNACACVRVRTNEPFHLELSRRMAAGEVELAFLLPTSEKSKTHSRVVENKRPPGFV